LVLLSHAGQRGSDSSFSYLQFERFRDQNQVFSSLCASRFLNISNVIIDGQMGQVKGVELVSGNYFLALGVNSVLGRTFTLDDDKGRGGRPVAVISYSLWQRNFGLSPSVLGKSITINDFPFSIIGVAPPEFFGESVGFSPDIWIPLTMQVQVTGGKSRLDSRGTWWLQLMARLAPGISERQAHSRMNLLLQQVGSEVATPDERKNYLERIDLSPGGKGLPDLRQNYSRPLLILMAVVTLVLVIACANITNLLLVRSIVRRKEIAMRMALGASRARVLRQLLVESALLALIGGIAGLLFAYWTSSFLLTLLPHGTIPIAISFHLDYRVLGFTIIVSLATGILCGLIPSLRAGHANLNQILKQQTGNLSAGGSILRTGRVLVIFQVAISLLLLIGAGLLVRSLQKLKDFDAGFNREDVLVLTVDASKSGLKDVQLGLLSKELLERLSNTAGASSTSLSNYSLFGPGKTRTTVDFQGDTSNSSDNVTPHLVEVSPRFFETMGIQRLLGRDFDLGDNVNSPKVAIINESMARHFFQNDSPIGKRFGLDGPMTSGDVEIIGLVKDVKYDNLREKSPFIIYLPFFQAKSPHQSIKFEVRASGNPTALASALRQEVLSFGQGFQFISIRRLAEQVDDTFSRERSIAKLSSAFSLAALLLSCLGLYGTMSYSVAQRTVEIGIRIALGAERLHISWMVLREMMLLVFVGMAFGSVAALAATRLLSTMLFDLKTTDPVTILTAVLLMLAVAAFAGYSPARRASRVDPLVAMRAE
jgi:predicted permease